MPADARPVDTCPAVAGRSGAALTLVAATTALPKIDNPARSSAARTDATLLSRVRLVPSDVDPARDDGVMSELPEVPQFGALLREHIDSVPAHAMPAFLAGLERSAAARYRSWADQAPEWREELLACADSEDRIAELVAGLFPVDDETQEQIDTNLVDAIRTYYDVFSPHPVMHQLYLQSEAELQGAMAWVRLAADLPEELGDDQREHIRAVLAECTELERQSSVVVKRLLDESLSSAG
jgi:hypothetical protein